jgi:glycosyltransferase involved in cell wall biosynthesis
MTAPGAASAMAPGARREAVPGLLHRARVAWRVLRAEGWNGSASRALDRLADARRRRSFLAAAEPPPGFRCAVLSVAAAEPSPRLGGVQAQLLWRLAEEARLRPTALLYPDPSAGGFRLELRSGATRHALHFSPGVQPPAAAGLADRRAPAPPAVADPAVLLDDPRFEAAVAWAAARTGAQALHVEGLARQPLASLLRLREGGLRLLLAVHDFAAFCPRPHLFEEPPPPAARRFCGYSRDPARCAACLATAHSDLPPGYQEERRILAGRLLAAADAVVYASEFLARRHAALFPGAGASRSRCIAPAIAEKATKTPAGAIPPAVAGASVRRPALHVAWVGAVLEHKGALVFEAALQALATDARAAGLRFTAYGGGDAAILRRWRRQPGLRLRGYHRAGSLPELLRREGVDLALLLSVVPESHGLTLDECAAAGVPAIAFAHGALGDRLAGSGLLIDAALAADPVAAGAALAAILRDLRDGRRPLPPPPPRAAGAAAAARAWLALYRSLGLTPGGSVLTTVP